MSSIYASVMDCQALPSCGTLTVGICHQYSLRLHDVDFNFLGLLRSKNLIFGKKSEANVRIANDIGYWQEFRLATDDLDQDQHTKSTTYEGIDILAAIFSR